MSSYAMVKAGTAIPIASVLDRQLMGVYSVESNLMFGCITGASLYAGTFVANMIPVNISEGNSFVSGKTLVERVIEISAGSVIAYTMNRGLGNDTSPADMTRRLGILVLTDVASSYAADYIVGQPLTYLTGNV